MVAIEQALATEIRRIIARDLDVTNAWDDDRVVRAAEQRLCQQAGAHDVASLRAAMPDYWRAVVQQARHAHPGTIESHDRR